MQEANFTVEGDTNTSDFRTKWNLQLKNEDTHQLLERDSNCFLHQALSTPCLDVLEKSSGTYLHNTEGKKYIDFHGNSVHQLGHNNTFVTDKIIDQLNKLPFSPRRFTNLPAIEFAEKLVALTQHALKRVLFAPSGATAVSIALKLARVVTGKYKTISMYDAFHGATLDSISVGGEYQFQHSLGPLLTGSIHVPPVDTYRGMWYDATKTDSDIAYADYIEYIIQKEGDVGAIIAEPIRSTTCHIPSVNFWKRVREICNQNQVLLIFDEIPTGMGRTGKMFAYEHFDIVPDMLILGKGLGAGIIPMAALLCREAFNVAATISLGHFTHEKNPLGAVAGLAAIEYMEVNNMLTVVALKEQLLKEKLQEMQKKLPTIGHIRFKGMLAAIELVKDQHTKEKHNELAENVLYRCLNQGLSLKVSEGNVLTLYPPLTISDTELAEALSIVENSIQSAISTT